MCAGHVNVWPGGCLQGAIPMRQPTRIGQPADEPDLTRPDGLGAHLRLRLAPRCARRETAEIGVTPSRWLAHRSDGFDSRCSLCLRASCGPGQLEARARGPVDLPGLLERPMAYPIFASLAQKGINPHRRETSRRLPSGSSRTGGRPDLAQCSSAAAGWGRAAPR